MLEEDGNRNVFDHANDGFVSRNFTRLMIFKAHWLVTHLHVSHISAVFIRVPQLYHHILRRVEDATANRSLLLLPAASKQYSCQFYYQHFYGHDFTEKPVDRI